jgi:hypothetical protein
MALKRALKAVQLVCRQSSLQRSQHCFSTNNAQNLTSAAATGTKGNLIDVSFDETTGKIFL